MLCMQQELVFQISFEFELVSWVIRPDGTQRWTPVDLCLTFVMKNLSAKFELSATFNSKVMGRYRTDRRSVQHLMPFHVYDRSILNVCVWMWRNESEEDEDIRTMRASMACLLASNNDNGQLSLLLLESVLLYIASVLLVLYYAEYCKTCNFHSSVY